MIKTGWTPPSTLVANLILGLMGLFFFDRIIGFAGCFRVVLGGLKKLFKLFVLIFWTGP